ncbi:MAG: hypothetical protein AB4426_05050 [Xenococcaceae cyanobacterium]
MQSTITISGQLLGRSRPLFKDWQVSLPPDLFDRGKHPTLRDVLTRIVLEEVEGFRSRQEQRRLTRLLTKTAIAQGIAQGKVDMGGRDLGQEVEPQAAVDNVLQAFEDGLYYVFINDEQQQELDREIYLQPNSYLTFLRLVPLVGG